MTEADDISALSVGQQDTASLLERLLGRAIADRYVDFCRFASGAFELRVSRPVAAHALRELEGIMRRTLKASLEIRPVEEPFDPLHARAREELSKIGIESAAIERAIETLKPRTNQTNQIRQITASLGLASDGDVAEAWIALAKAAGKAHQHSFHESLLVDDEFRQAFQQPCDTVLRAVVLALERRYSVIMRRVEEIATMPDKAQAAKLFAAEVPGAMPLQWHFYQRLTTADWLPHLLTQKLMGPPLPEFGGTAVNAGRFGEWPAGSYLRRMAESGDTNVRRQVSTAVRNIASSKHLDVRRTGLDIISALPAPEAASHVDVAVDWLDPNAQFMTLHPAEQLVKRLANGGEPVAALRVASYLLQVFSDDQGNIRSLYGQHMYEHSLPQLVPILTKACGVDALKLLSDLLFQAAVVSGKVGTEPIHDYTAYDQGPLTDDSSANYSVYDALKCQVRLAAEQIIGADATQLSGVLNALGAHAPKLFCRLEMFMLAKHPAAMPDRARSLLLDAELLEASWCKHEYAALALAWFPSLAPPDQQTVLQQADAIPARYVASWRVRVEERENRLPNAKEERGFSACTVRDAMWNWRVVLPPDRQAALEEIVAEFGDPDAWRGVVWGQQEDSPLPTADFASQTTLDIAAFLRTWQPGQEPRRHTVTALAQELRNAVSQNPGRYAQEAMEFADLPAIYVHRLLEGLTDAARNQRDFCWGTVLPLLASTFARMNELIDPASVAEGNDPTWHWGCAAGAELLKAGLRRGATGISFAHKVEVQDLVLTLMRRAPQAPELEDFAERYERNAYHAAEATLRGSAVELCMLLTYWLSKEEGSDYAATPREAFAQNPTVPETLEAELADLSPNGSIPRAILGRYLRWLSYFGESWLTAHMSAIFADDTELHDAAWLGHLLHDDGPLDPKLEDLRGDYGREIERLTDTSNDREDYRQKRLGLYLATLYLSGALELDADGLLARFLGKASGRLRQHVMWALGQNLQKPLGDFPEPQRTRVLTYWDARLAAAETSHRPDEFKGELGALGQWCNNHQIDPNWLFDRLLRMLRAGFAPANAYDVVSWLAKVRATHIDRAIKLLEELLMNQNVEPWVYIGQEEAIRALLTEGQLHGTNVTAKRVGELISYLASVGRSGYMDI